MIDRNTAPPAHKIQSIEFICPQTIEINRCGLLDEKRIE